MVLINELNFIFSIFIFSWLKYTLYIYNGLMEMMQISADY